MRAAAWGWARGGAGVVGQFEGEAAGARGWEGRGGGADQGRDVDRDGDAAGQTTAFRVL